MVNQSNKAINDRKAIVQKEIAGFKVKIEKTEDKLIDGEIDSATFERMHTRYQAEIVRSTSSQIKLNSNHNDFRKHLSFCLPLLQSLPDYFKNAQVELKQKIVSSIFPDKLVFDGENYRTPRINEVLSLIFRNIGGQGEPQKEKVVISDNFSCRVVPPDLRQESFCLQNCASHVPADKIKKAMILLYIKALTLCFC
jgi:hypothetical protein